MQFVIVLIISLSIVGFAFAVLGIKFLFSKRSGPTHEHCGADAAGRLNPGCCCGKGGYCQAG